MVVHLALVAPVAVVVPELGIAAGRVVVEHPVRVHHVVPAEHARQRAPDDGIVEDELKLGHQGEQVVAGVVVVVLSDELDEAVEHLTVKGGGQVGLKRYVAVRDEGPHLLVRQPLQDPVVHQVGALLERRNALSEIELPLVLPDRWLRRSDLHRATSCRARPAAGGAISLESRGRDARRG